MKIIILLEKYGGLCNRLFQSLHFHAYAIENKIVFLNPSLLGILRYDNFLFSFLDKFNNLFLKSLSILITFFFGKDNYIRFVKGWNFRVTKLTSKHRKILSELYRFKRVKLSKKVLFLINNLKIIKAKGKFIVGIHIRRGDYKYWKNGKYYFSDKKYARIIQDLKKLLVSEDKDPYFLVFSNENYPPKVDYDFFSNGTAKEDLIVLQNCDLIVGPPSTFSMWASYISCKPLIILSSSQEISLNQKKINKG